MQRDKEVQSPHGSSVGHAVSRRNSYSHSLSRGNSFIHGGIEYLQTEKTMEEAIHILSLQSPDSGAQAFRRVSAKLRSTDSDRIVSHSGKLRERQRTGSGFLRRKNSDLEYPALKDRQKSNLEDILVEGWSLCFTSAIIIQVCFGVTYWNFFNLTLVLLNPDIPCICKQCRSRSVGFWRRSQLIWICTVCQAVCEFILTTWIKESDWLTNRNGCGILIYSAWQGLNQCPS